MVVIPNYDQKREDSNGNQTTHQENFLALELIAAELISRPSQNCETNRSNDGQNRDGQKQPPIFFQGVVLFVVPEVFFPSRRLSVARIRIVLVESSVGPHVKRRSQKVHSEQTRAYKNDERQHHRRLLI